MDTEKLPITAPSLTPTALISGSTQIAGSLANTGLPAEFEDSIPGEPLIGTAPARLGELQTFLAEEPNWMPLEGDLQSSVDPLQQLTDSETPSFGEAASGDRQRKEQTEATYLLWVRRVIKASTDVRTIDDQNIPVVSPVDIANDFIESAKTRSAQTWRAYRAALLWYFGQHRHEASYAQAHDMLVQSRLPVGPKPGKSRKATKSKGIPAKDLAALINQLGAMNHSQNNWGARTQYFLMAGIETGLRPTEWNSANWEDETKQAIICVTAKQKMAAPAYLRPTQPILGEVAAEASDAEMDPVPESGADADDSTDSEIGLAPRLRRIPVQNNNRIYVELHMHHMRAHPEGGEHYYEACRRTIWRACTILWKGRKSYSLYDARHQFAANTKASNPLADAAELMGHGNERATMVYANRSHAHNSSSSDVSSQRQIDTQAATTPVDQDTHQDTHPEP